jgi:hypothetical protein
MPTDACTSWMISLARAASYVGACRSPKTPPPRKFGGRRCQSPVAFAPPVRHMTGGAGDTTATDSRSQRNRASRRGGQLLTRALGSSCVSACPHFVLPVPLSRCSHHTPRCRTPQPNVGTEKSHTGYQSAIRRGAATHQGHPHAFGERPVLKLMYATLIRAAERWRGLRMTEFERRQLIGIRNELGRAHAERTAPVVNANVATSPTRLSSKSRT